MMTDFDKDFESIPSAIQERADALAVRGASNGLGVVVAGSLSKGLDVKLNLGIHTEELAVGNYVVARSGGHSFFCMITDVLLDATNREISKSPPDFSDSFIAQVHQGTTTFGILHLSPLLVLQDGSKEPKPVKTIPQHFTIVTTASQKEVDEVFGEEGTRLAGGKENHFFHVGTPLDMKEVKITLNLERLVERSSGVFGKSGTGKTFLSRLLLAGVIQQNVAVNLIFDMHNEYGWAGTSEELSGEVKGLSQILPGRVSIFTLDPESTTRRKAKFDFPVMIGYDDLEPEDMEMLAGILNLTEAQIGAVYALRRQYGRKWLRSFLSDKAAEEQGEQGTEGKSGVDLKALAEQLGQPYQTLAALRRHFNRMDHYGFLSENPPDNSVDRIMQYLDGGQNVVLEFGKYGRDMMAYILVANYLTRRIHERYVHKTEERFGDKDKKVTPLVITIEEAHKFLDPKIAANTIFGTIARELRKYNVTLFIIDQRPSGIDEEVMSQIGTRVTMLLDNPKDIEAVLTGVSGAGGLKEVLARLDTREQALILGHAVPMPVVVRTRRYDIDFYRAMGFRDSEERALELVALDQKTGRVTNFAGFD